jgi:tetratricopeptide (TPR) repeat protein
MTKSFHYQLDLQDKPIAIGVPNGFAEEEAMERFEKSQDLFNIGINLEEEGDHERASVFYTESIKVNPNMSLAFLHRGKIALERNQYEQALNDFFTYRKQQPNCSRVLLYLSRLSLELFKGSKDDFHKNNSRRYLDWAIQKNENYSIFRAGEN